MSDGGRRPAVGRTRPGGRSRGVPRHATRERRGKKMGVVIQTLGAFREGDGRDGGGGGFGTAKGVPRRTLDRGDERGRGGDGEHVCEARGGFRARGTLRRARAAVGEMSEDGAAALWVRGFCGARAFAVRILTHCLPIQDFSVGEPWRRGSARRDADRASEGTTQIFLSRVFFPLFPTLPSSHAPRTSWRRTRRLRAPRPAPPSPSARPGMSLAASPFRSADPLGAFRPATLGVAQGTPPPPRVVPVAAVVPSPPPPPPSPPRPLPRRPPRRYERRPPPPPPPPRRGRSRRGARRSCATPSTSSRTSSARDARGRTRATRRRRPDATPSSAPSWKTCATRSTTP